MTRFPVGSLFMPDMTGASTPLVKHEFGFIFESGGKRHSGNPVRKVIVNGVNLDSRNVHEAADG